MFKENLDYMKEKLEEKFKCKVEFTLIDGTIYIEVDFMEMDYKIGSIATVEQITDDPHNIINEIQSTAAKEIIRRIMES